MTRPGKRARHVRKLVRAKQKRNATAKAIAAAATTATATTATATTATATSATTTTVAVAPTTLSFDIHEAHWEGLFESEEESEIEISEPEDNVPEKVQNAFEELPENCEYSLNDLRQTISKAFESIPVATINRFYQHCARIINAYNDGFQYGTKEFANHVCIKIIE